MLSDVESDIQRNHEGIIKRLYVIGIADFGGSYFCGIMSDIQRKIVLSSLYQKSGYKLSLTR